MGTMGGGLRPGPVGALWVLLVGKSRQASRAQQEASSGQLCLAQFPCRGLSQALASHLLYLASTRRFSTCQTVLPGGGGSAPCWARLGVG